MQYSIAMKKYFRPMQYAHIANQIFSPNTMT